MQLEVTALGTTHFIQHHTFSSFPFFILSLSSHPYHGKYSNQLFSKFEHYVSFDIPGSWEKESETLTLSPETFKQVILKQEHFKRKEKSCGKEQNWI